MHSLLENAARTADRIFTLVPPDAPGAHFCGVMFKAGGQPFSAGAADLDPDAAQMRCPGEIAETCAQFAPVQDFPSAPQGHGLDEGEKAALVQMNGGDGGSWLAATRLAGGALVSVPAALCLRFGAGGAFAASSLGCAAGQTRDAALRSAVFEVIERDAIALWWHGGVPPLEVPEARLLSARACLVQARQGLTGRQTCFLALQSAADVPVVCALSCNASGQSMAFGFGAAEEYETAAIKAVLELLQMELGNHILSLKADRLGLDTLGEADLDIHRRMTLLDLSMVPFQPSGQAISDPVRTVADIAAHLSRKDIAVYAVDLFRADSEVPVVKVLAPALQPLPVRRETIRYAAARQAHAVRLAQFPAVVLL